MGLTTANRDHGQDLTIAYNRVRDYAGSDISDVAAVLGSGTRYAREIVGLLVHTGLLVEDADGLQIANDTEDVVHWVEAQRQNAPEPKLESNQIKHPCRCGCGFNTNHPGSTYLPGHDARHAGHVARAMGDPGLSDEQRSKLLEGLPSQALQAKAIDLAMRWATKAEAKGKTRTITATGSAKKGRWTYPTRTWSDGVTERNAKRDGSGEWVTV